MKSFIDKKTFYYLYDIHNSCRGEQHHGEVAPNEYTPSVGQKRSDSFIN